jgi:DMSO/TMAO reductase YedYZ molybdopterin-dependent catalytic subunit
LRLTSSPVAEKKSSTVHRKIRACIPIVLGAVLAQLLPLAPKACAQSSGTAAELSISGAVSTPLVLTVANLKKMPRKTLSVTNPHNKKTETYEGVLVEELLRRGGVPLGEQLRGASLATYVIAEAEDGYRVVFSLAELDSGILESEAIVADTMDGAPLASPTRSLPTGCSAREASCTLGQNAQVHHRRPC